MVRTLPDTVSYGVLSRKSTLGGLLSGSSLTLGPFSLTGRLDLGTSSVVVKVFTECLGSPFLYGRERRNDGRVEGRHEGSGFGRVFILPSRGRAPQKTTRLTPLVSATLPDVSTRVGERRGTRVYGKQSTGTLVRMIYPSKIKVCLDPGLYTERNRGSHSVSLVHAQTWFRSSSELTKVKTQRR